MAYSANQAFPKNSGELKRLFQSVQSELRAIGVPIRQVRNVSINRRLKTSLGRCGLDLPIHTGLDTVTFHIELSAGLLEKKHLGMLKDVIAHELIHTAPGCMNHSSEFQYWAEHVNENLDGYNVHTKMEFADYGLESCAKLYKEEATYLVRCPNCHAEIYRKRHCSVVDHPERYRCARCGSKLERVY